MVEATTSERIRWGRTPTTRESATRWEMEGAGHRRAEIGGAGDVDVGERREGEQPGGSAGEAEGDRSRCAWDVAGRVVGAPERDARAEQEEPVWGGDPEHEPGQQLCRRDGRVACEPGGERCDADAQRRVHEHRLSEPARSLGGGERARDRGRERALRDDPGELREHHHQREPLVAERSRQTRTRAPRCCRTLRRARARRSRPGCGRPSGRSPARRGSSRTRRSPRRPSRSPATARAAPA